MKMDLVKLINEVRTEYVRLVRNEDTRRTFANIMANIHPEMILLGSGTFGSVFTIPGYEDRVVRIGTPQVDNWFKTAEYGSESQNELFMKVYDVDVDGMFGAAIIEKLTHVPKKYADEFVQLTNKLRKFEIGALDLSRVYDHSLAMSESVHGWTSVHVDHLLKLREYLKSKNVKFHWDCYERNFMMRGETVVITDPIS